MTIEKSTRDRWRALFTSPDCTRGPWASYHGLHGSEVTCPQYRCTVASSVTQEDANFIAEARTGWPMTLDALELAERANDDLRNVITLLEADATAREEVLATFRDGADLSNERARVARQAFEQVSMSLVELSAETRKVFDRHDRLAAAVEKWVKHRYADGLLQAWEEFNRGT